MYCEHCGFRVETGEECTQCAKLDFRFIDDSEKPIDVDDILWAEDGGYVIETTRWWSNTEYIAIRDPDEIDNVFEKTDGERASGFLSALKLLRGRR
jgi:hypothetical protein